MGATRNPAAGAALSPIARLQRIVAVNIALVSVLIRKAIGASPEAKPLLDKAGVVTDGGVTGVGEDFVQAAKTRFWDREATLRLLA